MSYNSLTSLGPLSRYPACLKQLDLSHNQISCWPLETDHDSHCYGSGSGSGAVRDEKTISPSVCSTPEPRKISRSAATRQNSRVFCPHRRHVKLEQLRSLILADNLLREISLHLNLSDSASNISEVCKETFFAFFFIIFYQDSSDQPGENTAKQRLMYPNLSKLDVSNNSIKTVPSAISELTNLSTLHISGNENIVDLPPEMGLLSRLWNLTTK